MKMTLLPVQRTMDENSVFMNNPDCRESLEMSVIFYSNVGYNPPWIGYYVDVNGVLVGAAGFKGRPVGGKVEIAYGTFPAHQRQGIGAEICRQLVALAQSTDPLLMITARTLPEENYSSKILRKNGFECQGIVTDDDDGDVWEWVFKKDESVFSE